MGLNIGFVSTRFAGTDGVSLEAAKWAEVLWELGHVSFWFAGELDRDPKTSMLEPLAHFAHEDVQWIQNRIFGTTSRPPEVSERIHSQRAHLKKRLYDFVRKFDIDLLIPQNALTIPMHVSLGLAIAEFIAETGIPTIAHHHDFYWERTRFAVNAIPDIIGAAFPIASSRVQHVCINTAARDQLAYRTGLSSTVLPNVLRFEDRPPEEPDEYSKDIRQEFGIGKDDILILQPTRVVPRKGIEHAIELVKQLDDPRCKLVITHGAGDEGTEYLEYLNENAARHGVSLNVVAERVHDKRRKNGEGKKVYTLWDVYPHADLVTYPSLYEGFGNAFLEGILFRKPMMVNRYSVYQTDIELLGFDVVSMEQYLTKRTVEQVREVLNNAERRKRMVEHNYELALKHFSFTVLEKKLKALLANFFGRKVHERKS